MNSPTEKPHHLFSSSMSEGPTGQSNAVQGEVRAASVSGWPGESSMRLQITGPRSSECSAAASEMASSLSKRRKCVTAFRAVSIEVSV